MIDERHWMDRSSAKLNDIELDAMLFRAQSHGLGLTLASDTDTDTIPGCWVGGKPSLPPDVPWPYLEEADWKTDEITYSVPMHFIAQFDLAQFPRFAHPPMLPKRGMLFFFYDPLAYGDGGGRVLYFPDASHGDPSRDMPDFPEEHAKELDHAVSGNYPHQKRKISVKHLYIGEIYDRDLIACTQFEKEARNLTETQIDDKISGFFLLGGRIGSSEQGIQEFQKNTRLLTISANNALGIREPSGPPIIFWIGEHDLFMNNFENIHMEENSNG